MSKRVKGSLLCIDYHAVCNCGYGIKAKDKRTYSMRLRMHNKVCPTPTDWDNARRVNLSINTVGALKTSIATANHLIKTELKPTASLEN